ncbi:MAG: hypothetical protein ACOYXW_04665 [Actinomycetota bacterium]
MGVAGATPAIEATGLRKTFAGVAAVDGVDLHVEAGTVLGLLGPNGAGKNGLHRHVPERLPVRDLHP